MVLLSLDLYDLEGITMALIKEYNGPDFRILTKRMEFTCLKTVSKKKRKQKPPEVRNSRAPVLTVYDRARSKLLEARQTKHKRS